MFAKWYKALLKYKYLNKANSVLRKEWKPLKFHQVALFLYPLQTRSCHKNRAISIISFLVSKCLLHPLSFECEMFWLDVAPSQHVLWIITKVNRTNNNDIGQTKYIFQKPTEAYQNLKHLFGLGLDQYQNYHACEIHSGRSKHDNFDIGRGRVQIKVLVADSLCGF